MMEVIRCVVYLILVCLLTPLYQGTEVCSNHNPGQCCRCQQGNCTSCPDGFIKSTSKECMLETVHSPEANNTTPPAAPNETDDRDDMFVCRRCPRGFFLDNSQTTHCCDPACWTCKGIGNKNCTSCTIIHNGVCVASCPDGYHKVDLSEESPTETETTTRADSSVVSVSSRSTGSASSTSSVPDDETEFDSMVTCTQSDTLPITLIVGSCVGATMFIIIFIVVTCVLIRRRRSRNSIPIKEFNNLDVGNKPTDNEYTDEFKPNEIFRVNDMPPFNQSGSNTPTELEAHSEQHDHGRNVAILTKQSEPKVDSGQKGLLPQDKTSVLERGYVDVVMKEVPTKSTRSDAQITKKGKEEYDSVKSKNTPTETTSGILPDKMSVLDSTYADVIIKKIPTKSTGSDAQSTKKVTEEYEAVKSKNTTTKQTRPVLPSTKKGLENYDKMSVLEGGYEVLDLKKVPTKSTGVTNEVTSGEKEYDDATVGGPCFDGNAYADL